MNSPEKKYDIGLLKTLSSIQFGIIIMISIVVISVVGTIIPQGQSADYYREQYSAVTSFIIKVFRFDITYHSPLFLSLSGLLGMNLFLCSLLKFPAILKKTFMPDTVVSAEKIARLPIYVTVQDKTLDDIGKTFTSSGFRLRKIDNHRLFGEKWRIGYLGSSFIHLSLLILLLGGLVSLVTGRRGKIILEKGHSVSEVTFPGKSTIPLGFEISLNHFDVEFYEDFPGRPKSYTSSVTVTKPSLPSFDTDIRVNHPLICNGFPIFQSGYGKSKVMETAVSDNDTAIVDVRLKGIPAEVPPLAVFVMVKGVQYPVPGFEDSIKISMVELHGDFKHSRSVSGEPNPAVKLEVIVHDVVKWSVYAFKNFPRMNMPMEKDLNILFTMQDIKNSGSKIASNNEEYYTVLGVVKDKGSQLMWAGAFIMSVGMLFSFFVRPERIWVCEVNGRILIGATTRGDHDSHRQFINKTVNNT